MTRLKKQAMVRVNGVLVNKNAYEHLTQNRGETMPESGMITTVAQLPTNYRVYQDVMVRLNPEMAREFLKRNRNRNHRQESVDTIARDMTAGNYHDELRDPMGFDEEGNFRQGQHRCLAVIKSGVTITVRVIYGLSADACRAMDTGISRTYADILRLAEVPHSSQLSAAVKFVWNYEYNYQYGRSRVSQPSRAETDSLRLSTPQLTNSLLYGNRCREVIWPSVGAGVHYLIHCIAGTQADRFFTDIAAAINNVGLSNARHPVAKLLKVLHTHQRQGRRVYPIEQTYLILTAWNAYAEGRLTGALSFTRDAVMPKICRPTVKSFGR